MLGSDALASAILIIVTRGQNSAPRRKRLGLTTIGGTRFIARSAPACALFPPGPAWERQPCSTPSTGTKQILRRCGSEFFPSDIFIAPNPPALNLRLCQKFHECSLAARVQKHDFHGITQWNVQLSFYVGCLLPFKKVRPMLWCELLKLMLYGFFFKKLPKIIHLLE